MIAPLTPANLPQGLECGVQRRFQTADKRPLSPDSIRTLARGQVPLIIDYFAACCFNAGGVGVNPLKASPSGVAVSAKTLNEKYFEILS